MSALLFTPRVRYLCIARVSRMAALWGSIAGSTTKAHTTTPTRCPACGCIRIAQMSDCVRLCVHEQEREVVAAFDVHLEHLASLCELRAPSRTHARASVRRQVTAAAL